MRSFPTLSLNDLLGSSRLMTLAEQVLSEEREAYEDAAQRASFHAAAASFRAEHA